jgi:hypothetical protein
VHSIGTICTWACLAHRKRVRICDTSWGCRQSSSAIASLSCGTPPAMTGIHVMISAFEVLNRFDSIMKWNLFDSMLSYPGCKRVELKPRYVCPGHSNHTYNNNTIIRWNIWLQQSNISYIMTRRSQKDYRAANSGYTKRSTDSTGLTIGEAHLAFFIFTLLEFLVPASHAI